MRIVQHGTANTDGEVVSPFRPILGSRAHEEVVDQITFAIRAGIYRPGDRLPRMEDLARQLNVSKPTISEALRVLSSGGVVEVHRGATGGAIVTSTDVPITMMRLASGGRASALTDLVEARRPVELEVARLVVRRASSRDVELLREAVEGLEAALAADARSGQQLLHFDSLFHYGMGRAARSELLFYFQHRIFEQLAVWRLDFYERRDSDAAISAHCSIHRETLQAVEDRDEDRIIAVTERHLEGLERLAVELGESAQGSALT